MARIYANQLNATTDLVAEWGDKCLVNDGSLLTEEHVWTEQALGTLYDNIVKDPLTDGRSFQEKLKEQVKGDASLAELAAESLVIYYLFASNSAISAATKRDRVNEVLDWRGSSLPQDSSAWRALGEHGIGHPGQFFLLRPDAQLGFILQFARRLKENHDADGRRTILNDPWQTRDLADAATEDSSAAMRHITLHLLHADQFERISSGDHKRGIATTYAKLLDEDSAPADIDERILAIRGALANVLGKPSESLDFYEPPLYGTWGSPRDGRGPDPVELLSLKRQIVLFGPPGTSKTYEAKQLASQIIRRRALETWGAVEFFKRQDELNRLAAVEDSAQSGHSHVRRLQLHPAYSYEEFIRGMRLHNGTVTYEDGYLLRLVAEIRARNAEDGDAALPWVLILDEMNRADLSRVFGEAFSVFENRDEVVELPGREAGKDTATISLPKNLYVIGTMNLIDQSLEQIDFALRRRFLWRRSGFDSQRLGEVLQENWANDQISRRYDWDRVAADMDRFRGRAEQLNEQIAASKLLGRDYEIGHTYFFDVVGLLARAEHMHRQNRASQILFDRKGNGRPPVTNIWDMSIEPLLDQYLQGADPDARTTELARLRGVFVKGAS